MIAWELWLRISGHALFIFWGKRKGGDGMWVFGSKSMSKGCMIEKNYSKRYKIPIIERGECIIEK